MKVVPRSGAIALENPTTLLVAIMYTTLVATGLISVVMALSDVVTGQRKMDPVHTAWLAVLIISYLSFFWETTAILEFDAWAFLPFVSFISGPIVLLFATNLIAAAPGGNEAAVLREFFLRQCPRFFLLLFLVQAWVVGLDLLFDSVGYETYATALTGVLLLVLMFSRNYRTQLAGVVLVGVTLVVQAVLEAL